jgi:hypothetical protein
MKIIGKRTIAAAAAKVILSVASAKRWIPPEVADEQTITALQEGLTALIVWFLALKVVRVEEKVS